MEDRPIRITNVPYPLKLASDKQFPLPIPNTVCSFDKKLSNEEEQAIQMLGAIVTPAKKETESNRYRFPEGVLTSTGLGALLQHPKKVNHYTITTYGQANLAAVLAFLRVKAIFTLFIQTQYYPAFRVEGEVADAILHQKGFFTLKRKDGSHGKGRATQRIRQEEMGSDEGEVEEDEEMEDLDGDITEFYSDRTENIPLARPPVTPYKGFGSSAEAPQTFGLVFPYFDGLLDDDTQYVSRVINEYFLLSLGTDTKECSLQANAIRGGMGQFASSSIGRILTHVAAGIRLAIQGQAQIFLHISGSGRYSGFSLHGAGFTVNIQGRMYEPDDESGLRHDLARVDEHVKSLAEILKVAAEVIGKRTVNVPKKKTKTGEVTSARDLHQYLSALTFTDEQREKILAEGTRLSFPEKPWRMTVENLIRIITHLVDEESLPIDAPMYLGGGTLLTSNLAVRNMSVFGELGFSFKTPNGSRFKLPKSRADDVLYKETKDSKGKVRRPMRTFVIQKKGLETCASDWGSFLLDRTMEVREQRSSAFKSEVFGGDAGKRLWMHLVDVIPKLESGSAAMMKEIELEGERGDGKGELDFSDFL
jgi:hypothetical protein